MLVTKRPFAFIFQWPSNVTTSYHSLSNRTPRDKCYRHIKFYKQICWHHFGWTYAHRHKDLVSRTRRSMTLERQWTCLTGLTTRSQPCLTKSFDSFLYKNSNGILRKLFRTSLLCQVLEPTR